MHVEEPYAMLGVAEGDKASPVEGYRAVQMETAPCVIMGFKVLAAGAIEPEDGFNWAFRNGADFICVGMFDFHIRRNVKTVREILASKLDRSRPWRA